MSLPSDIFHQPIATAAFLCHCGDKEVGDVRQKHENLREDPAEKPSKENHANAGATHPVANALFSTAVVATAATLGSLATDPKSIWYRRLKKPDWQPPSSAFPVVWTALYAGAAVTSTRVLTRLQREGKTREAGIYRLALVGNMTLNAGWSYLFFQRKDLKVAAIEAGALAVSTACLARRAGKAGGQCALALSPYAVWTAFATVLSTDIWKRNA